MVCQFKPRSDVQEDVLRHVTGVLSMWAENGPADDLRPEDVCDEVFDVVKPRNPARITCTDLVVRCAQAASYKPA